MVFRGAGIAVGTQGYGGGPARLARVRGAVKEAAFARAATHV